MGGSRATWWEPCLRPVGGAPAPIRWPCPWSLAPTCVHPRRPEAQAMAVTPFPSGLWGPEEAPGVFSVWPKQQKASACSYLGARVSLWGSLPERLPSDPFHVHLSLSVPSPGLCVSLPAFLPTPISLSHSLSCCTLQSLYPSWLPSAVQTGPGPRPASGEAPGPQPARPEGGPRTKLLFYRLS